MLRVVVAAAFITTFSGHAFSQVKYGVKGGLNISDVVINNYVNPDAESDYDLKLGAHAGFFGSTQVSQKFFFRVEVLYSNKGVKAVSPVHLHYINVPLLGQYEVAPDLVVEIGPELGYLFSARSKYGDVSNIWDNKLDFGLCCGAHYKFSKTVGMGLRYYAGFASVIDVRSRDMNNNAGETIKYLNRVLQLSLTLDLGEKVF